MPFYCVCGHKFVTSGEPTALSGLGSYTFEYCALFPVEKKVVDYENAKRWLQFSWPEINIHKAFKFFICHDYVDKAQRITMAWYRYIEE